MKARALRLVDRYWLEKMGRKTDSDAGEIVAAKSEELANCETSQQGARLNPTEVSPARPSHRSAKSSHCHAPTGHAHAGSLAPKPAPETFPPGLAVPERPEIRGRRRPRLPSRSAATPS